MKKLPCSCRPWLILRQLCLLAAPAFAQSTADEIEALLETSAVSYGQAARFVLDAAGVTVSAGQAFQYAAGQNWLPKKASVNEAARLDGVALLVMRSFDIEGGLLYSLFKNPRYAYRELAYMEIIQGRIDPAMTVSGDTLLYIINKLLDN